MGPLSRLMQFEAGAPLHHIGPVIEVEPQGFGEGEGLGGPVHDDDVVHREGTLELGVFVELIQNQLGVGAPLKFEDDAHPLAVGLVTDVGDVLDPLGSD